MAKGITAVLAAWLLLAPAGAFAGAAEGAHYCASPYWLAAQIEVCPDNRLFSEAADQCRQRFENEVQMVTGQLAASFRGNQNRSVSAQRSKQVNSVVNLGQADVGLKDLIVRARLIRRDYEDYVTTIILPGNPGIDMLMAYNIYDLLSQNRCYRENRIRIEENIAWVERKIRELEATDAETNRLHGLTQGRAANLKAQAGAGVPLETRHAAGAGRVPAGKNPKRESTITGKIKNEKLP